MPVTAAQLKTHTQIQLLLCMAVFLLPSMLHASFFKYLHHILFS